MARVVPEAPGRYMLRAANGDEQPLPDTGDCGHGVRLCLQDGGACIPQGSENLQAQAAAPFSRCWETRVRQVVGPPMRPSDRSEWEISVLVQVQFYKTIREGSLFIRLSTRLASREAYACDTPRTVQQTIALPLSGPQVSSGVASHPLLVWVSDQGLFPAAMFLINSLGMRFAEGTVQVQRAR